MYLMPTHFGPMTGPRRGPDGKGYACIDTPKSTSYSVSFLTNAEQLEELLPEGFALHGEPVVTVYQIHMKEIEWLAGRGYNIMGVTFPATYTGKRDRAMGPFLTVLWENMTEPILTGREQLGFAKIYCEMPEPAVCRGETRVIAHWQGFRFLDMKLTNMREVAPADHPAPAAPRTDGVLTGLLHYKYIPRTGHWGEADAAYACLTPEEGSNSRLTGLWQGDGTVEFHPALLGGHADPVHDRQRVPQPRDQGIPRRHHQQDHRQQGSQRPAHAGVGIEPIVTASEPILRCTRTG